MSISDQELKDLKRLLNGPKRYAVAVKPVMAILERLKAAEKVCDEVLHIEMWENLKPLVDAWRKTRCQGILDD